MRILPTFVFLWALGLLSCSTQLNTIPIPEVYSANYWGEVAGARQGAPLSNPRIAAASRVPCTANAFDVTITEFASNGSKLTTLTLANVPKKPTSVLTKFKVDYQSLYCGSDTIGCTFTAANAELPWGIYKPVKSSQTKLTIQSFDSATGEIKGTYSIIMVPDRRLGTGTTSGPDTLRFQNCSFTTKLKGPNGIYEK